MDPVICGVDLLAYKHNLALAVEVKVRDASAPPLEWDAGSTIQAAAWFLEHYLRESGNQGIEDQTCAGTRRWQGGREPASSSRLARGSSSSDSRVSRHSRRLLWAGMQTCSIVDSSDRSVPRTLPVPLERRTSRPNMAEQGSVLASFFVPGSAAPVSGAAEQRHSTLLQHLDLSHLSVPDPFKTLLDLRIKKNLTDQIEKSFGDLGFKLEEARVKDPYGSGERRYICAHNKTLEIALLELPKVDSGESQFCWPPSSGRKGLSGQGDEALRGGS